MGLTGRMGPIRLPRYRLCSPALDLTLDSMTSNYMRFGDAFRVYPVRGYHGMFHLLYDVARREAVLIDTGMFGEMSRVAGILREIGLDWTGIKAILLTHGHLDHTGNLARLKELTGALVLAHPLEQPHIDGVYPYRGPGRICGGLESIGRLLFRYRPVAIDQALAPETELPYWDGLRVVHLPGHTAGHCGFFSEKHSLLFSGDLFADYWFSTHLPPPFLNSCPEHFEASLRKVKSLSPRYIIPNHYDRFDAEWHRCKFDRLATRMSSRGAS